MQWGYHFLLSLANKAMTCKIKFSRVIVLLVGGSKIILFTLYISFFDSLNYNFYQKKSQASNYLSLRPTWAHVNNKSG